MALIRHHMRLMKYCLHFSNGSQVLRVTARHFTSKGTSSTSPAPKATGKKVSEDKSASTTTTGETYEAKDYFNYTEWSYYDIESDMRKHRLPQPSAK